MREWCVGPGRERSNLRPTTVNALPCVATLRRLPRARSTCVTLTDSRHAQVCADSMAFSHRALVSQCEPMWLVAAGSPELVVPIVPLQRL